MELAKIGATPKGGCNRQALTDLDRQGRDLFISWCKGAGCTVTAGRMGNIFARRPGKRAEPCDTDACEVPAALLRDTT
jgi:beta-ureidopropionase / N-carbamoyl-L-amino-acid hydrolase